MFSTQRTFHKHIPKSPLSWMRRTNGVAKGEPSMNHHQVMKIPVKAWRSCVKLEPSTKRWKIASWPENPPLHPSPHLPALVWVQPGEVVMVVANGRGRLPVMQPLAVFSAKTLSKRMKNKNCLASVEVLMIRVYPPSHSRAVRSPMFPPPVPSRSQNVQ